MTPTTIFMIEIMIWNSVVWSIWSVRNEMVFSRRIIDVKKLVVSLGGIVGLSEVLDLL